MHETPSLWTCTLSETTLARQDVKDPGALMVSEVLDRIVGSGQIAAHAGQLLETNRFWKETEDELNHD